MTARQPVAPGVKAASRGAPCFSERAWRSPACTERGCRSQTCRLLPNDSDRRTNSCQTPSSCGVRLPAPNTIVQSECLRIRADAFWFADYLWTRVRQVHFIRAVIAGRLQVALLPRASFSVLLVATGTPQHPSHWPETTAGTTWPRRCSDTTASPRTLLAE